MYPSWHRLSTSSSLFCPALTAPPILLTLVESFKAKPKSSIQDLHHVRASNISAIYKSIFHEKQVTHMALLRLLPTINVGSFGRAISVQFWKRTCRFSGPSGAADIRVPKDVIHKWPKVRQCHVLCVVASKHIKDRKSMFICG